MRRLVYRLGLLCFPLLVLFGGGTMLKADTTRVELTLGILKPDRTIGQEDSFEVGEEIPAALDIAISSATFKRTQIRITVPRKDGMLEFVDLWNPFTASQREDVELEFDRDQENWYGIYTYKELHGEKFTPVFPFRFVEGKAYNGDQVTIRAELLDADTQQVLYQTEKTYQVKREEGKLNESVANIGFFSEGVANDPSRPIQHNRRFLFPVTVAEDQTTISNQRHTLYLHTIFNHPEHLKTARVKNIVYEVTLPEGFELQSTREWTRDPASRKATYTGQHFVPQRTPPFPLFAYENHLAKPFFSTSVPIVSKDAGLDQVHTIPVSFTVNKGEADEYQLPDRAVHLFYQKQLFQRTVKTDIDRSIELTYIHKDGDIYERYLRYPDTEWTAPLHKKHLTWRASIFNQNNGSGIDRATGGQTSAIYHITEHLGLSHYGNTLADEQDRRTYFSQFTLMEPSQAAGIGAAQMTEAEKSEQLDKVKKALVKNRLYGVEKDGNKVMIKEGLAIGETIQLDDATQRYVQLRLEFDEPVVLDNSTIHYEISRNLKASEYDKFASGQLTETRYSSSGGMYYHVGDQHPSLAQTAGNPEMKTNTQTSTTTLRQAELYIQDRRLYEEEFSPSAFALDNPPQTVTYNDEITLYSQKMAFSINGDKVGQLAKEKHKVQIIQLLPPGYEYGAHNSLANPDLAILHNYKETGKTALIYTFTAGLNDKVGVETRVRINRAAKDGISRIETYLVWDQNDQILPRRSAYTDELDLDNDGNKTERFMKFENTVNYILPLELSVTKSVYYQNADLFSFYATGELGQPFYYKVSLFNNSLRPVETMSLIDVLPAVGDHQITTNDAGQYLPRESAFSTPLVTFLEDVPENRSLLEMVEFHYQVTDQGADLESVRDGEWLTKDQVGADRLSQVRSIRYQLKSGKVLASGQKIDLYIQAAIPNDPGLEAGRYAVNTAAFSETNDRYTESNRAFITFAQYQVSGSYFNDFNKDGVKDTNEPPVSGQTVELIDEATGQVALDTNGQPLRTTTNDMGGYSFTLYKRGDYKVRFVKPDDAVFSMTQGTTGDILNHLAEENGNTATTKVVTVNPANPTARLNGAMTIEKRDIELVKQDQDGAPLAGAVFELRQAGLVIQTQTTNNEGKLIFRQVPFGTYTIVETKAPTGYSMEESPAGRSVTVDANVIELAPFVNRQIKGQVTLTKVDADNAAKKLANVTFVLKQGDEVKYTATTNDQGIATFTDVLYGDYTLVETETQADYVLSTETKAVKVETQGQIVNLGNITNTIRKATVLTEYVDQTGTALQPSTTQTDLPVNSTYTTTAPNEITTTTGLLYRLAQDQLPANATGTVIDTVTTVTYRYRPVEGTVTVRYINVETGEELQDPTLPYNPATVGSSYDVTTEAPATIRKGNDDYDLVGLQSGQETGTIIEGNIEVVYGYKYVLKKGSVVVHFIDEATGQPVQGAANPINDADEGTDYDVSDVPPATIVRGTTTYTLVGLQDGSSATGQITAGVTNVTYVYREVPKRGSVTVHFIDEATGQPIQDPTTPVNDVVVTTPYDVTGQAPAEITVGGVTYTLVGLQAGSSATGQVTEGTTNVTYVYRQVPKRGSVTVHFIDKTTGKAIQAPVTPVSDVVVTTPYDVTGQAPAEITVGGKRYRLVGLQSGQATGQVVEGDTTVIYAYEEIVEITPPTPDPVPTPDPTPTPEPAPTPEPSQPAAPAPQKVLPKTGQASSAWVAGLGFLLLAMTSFLAFKPRRR